jgi:hypothetical protein
LFEDLTSLEIAFSKPTEHSESASFWLMVGISLFVSLLLGHLGEGTFNRLLSCSSVDAAGHRHMKFLIHDWMIFFSRASHAVANFFFRASAAKRSFSLENTPVALLAAFWTPVGFSPRLSFLPPLPSKRLLPPLPCFKPGSSSALSPSLPLFALRSRSIGNASSSFPTPPFVAPPVPNLFARSAAFCASASFSPSGAPNRSARALRFFNSSS